jgi:hypothetical protein
MGAAALMCSVTDDSPTAGTTTGAAPPAAQKPLWQRIVDNLTTFVNAAQPFVDAVAVADPALAPAIGIGEKLLQGVLAEEPTAVQFWNQIQAGTPPTQAQLTQWAADYETSYQKLKADLAAKLAALPPGA